MIAGLLFTIMNHIVSESCYARIGLIGNPSDGFKGKTVSLLIKNFAATVHISASEKVEIIPHPNLDLIEFNGLNHLLKKTSVQVKIL